MAPTGIFPQALVMTGPMRTNVNELAYLWAAFCLLGAVCYVFRSRLG